MKTKLTLLASILSLSVIAAETRTVSLAWDHNGQNILGFKLYSREATNGAWAPLLTIPATNRTATVTLTNPSPWIEFVLTATNSWLESDMSNPVSLSKPTAPNAARVIAVVTVQVP